MRLVTKRHAVKLAKMLSLGVLRLVVLLMLFALISTTPVVWQLFLLPAGIALFLGMYVFQVPQLRLGRAFRTRVSGTLAAEPTCFGGARARATLFLRPPPSFYKLALAMAIVGIVVPFAWAELGRVCANGELIRISYGSSPFASDTGKSPYVLVGLFRLVCFVLIEEFVFRGWLLFPLRNLAGAPVAVAITSYLFAIGHIRPATGLLDMFAGVVFGTAVVLTGSIWSAVGLHFAFNAGVWGWDRFFDIYGAGAVSCALARPAFVVLTAALFFVLWLARRRAVTVPQ